MNYQRGVASIELVIILPLLLALLLLVVDVLRIQLQYSTLGMACALHCGSCRPSRPPGVSPWLALFGSGYSSKGTVNWPGWR